MSIARNELKSLNLRGVTTGRRLDPVHPGSVLLSDFIEPMGITRYRVAKAIGVQQRRIDEICAGERGITADTAVRLGLAFGVEPQFWLQLQAQYDIEVIQREQGDRLADEVQHLAAA
ncbi:HigA family addiction module antitoxin [Aquincola tertiaricarbonis]|uniref:HigA family addiction module antitoxin n=1 Tax=Aquincola tertiaricarbonis TaxID=391953 RepID=A0ABY4SAI1_AQUTE|nr:HigA family addiction module antitoxin [Aquincola tertiaricarbonis]URI08748.1 HigA family addiction module antitoxin [Aquincola tertiaricarbonis]